MANYYSHYRYRKYTTEYPRLEQSRINLYATLPVGLDFPLSWSSRGVTTTTINARKLDNSLLILTGKDTGYHIYFTESKLTYGVRRWYQCPSCGRRCGVLYLRTIFACRKCIKPAYECQNGSTDDYLGRKIIKLRTQLWGDKWPFNDALGEECSYWPKPKGIHWHTFFKKQAAIIELEQRRLNLYMASVRRFTKCF